MRYLSDLGESELQGKRVLVRAGLDVPIADGEVAGDFRVESAIATLAYLRERGARVIIISHIGRDESDTLAPVARILARSIPLTFIPDILGEKAHAAVAALQDGEMILLENLRHDPREVANDAGFAAALAALGDLYVNDAFSDCHRAHASIVGIPRSIPGVMGLELAEEVAHLTSALTPQSPSLCILAGAKFETKEPLIRKMLGIYDTVYVGGALANDIFRARGFEIGVSRASESVPAEDVLAHPHLLTPIDLTVKRADGTEAVVASDAMQAGDRNMDIGPRSFAALKELADGAAITLWNGPLGIYEEGYESWTIELAKAIAEANGRSIVGGGDTVTAIEDAGRDVMKRFTFVSTGGGAMLDFLAEGTLAGIEALS
jgi:phosphoglycerate kinase